VNLKVVELCNWVAGPYCSRLLADFGAEVIKQEKPGTGDPSRSRGPFFQDDPHLEKSGLFLYLNSGKLGVTLNIETGAGRELFKQLIADADVFVEDSPPGYLQELGLDYPALELLNPRLVMTSITPFGQDGPYSHYKAYHLNLCHGSGQGYMLPMNSTSLDREPVRAPGFAAEYDGGMSGAVATMAALNARRRTQTGQYIDVSIQQSIMHLERSQLRRYVDSGKSPNRTGMGRLLESLVECRDGNYVILILSSEKQWQGLFAAMGRPAWGTEEPFNTQAGRSAHYPELRRRLAAWARNYTAQEVFDQVQSFKSACAPAYTAAQFFSSPQILEREFLVEIDHPMTGPLTYPGLPYRFIGAAPAKRLPAPLLGQHNKDVFCDRLQFTQQDLVKLAQAGAI
jgi:crotonobetainyl-CoA:carnitine CoA-transferase CaiB-like acyl-CoA transferase